MIINAYAKINWDLYITGVCPDGYHELDSVMQPVSLHDTVTVDLKASEEESTLTVDGPFSAGVPLDGSNLAMKAADLFGEALGRRIPVWIRVTKHIPNGAGLGGGSADAAAVLLLLNEIHGGILPRDRMDALALRLGADVPFCLRRSACRACGIGEALEFFPMPEGAPLLLIMGSGKLDTGRVYRGFDAVGAVCDRDRISRSRASLIQGDYARFALEAENMLYPPALALETELREGIDSLRAEGAVFAAMTGSGAALFGVFRTAADAEAARMKLKEKYPCCLTARTGIV